MAASFTAYFIGLLRIRKESPRHWLQDKWGDRWRLFTDPECIYIHRYIYKLLLTCEGKPCYPCNVVGVFLSTGKNVGSLPKTLAMKSVGVKKLSPKMEVVTSSLKKKAKCIMKHPDAKPLSQQDLAVVHHPDFKGEALNRLSAVGLNKIPSWRRLVGFISRLCVCCVYIASRFLSVSLFLQNGFQWWLKR